jgi:hypothetical protein
MADDLDRRLAEIEEKNKAKVKAEKERAAKQKAAREKGKATQEQRAKDAAAAAEKNRDSRDYKAPEGRLNPQTEAGKAAKTRENVEKLNKQELANRYSQAFRKRENNIESYSKTGDIKYKQAALRAQTELEPIVAEYVKVFGNEPVGYKPTSKLSEPTGRTEGQMRQEAKAVPPTAVQSESREAARSAGRNAAPSAAVSAVAVSADPYIQNIINTAAKAGIQLSVADAMSAAGIVPGAGGGGGGGGSMASTQKRTTQYTMQQVRSAADSIYQNSIGRALNDDELRMLHQSLNGALKAEPTVTKTSAAGNSVTSGGVDERGFIQQQAEANPEFANYQKATTYFDAMLNSLQGPVGGGI